MFSVRGWVYRDKIYSHPSQIEEIKKEFTIYLMYLIAQYQHGLSWDTLPSLATPADSLRS